MMSTGLGASGSKQDLNASRAAGFANGMRAALVPARLNPENLAMAVLTTYSLCE